MKLPGLEFDCRTQSVIGIAPVYYVNRITAAILIYTRGLQPAIDFNTVSASISKSSITYIN